MSSSAVTSNNCDMNSCDTTSGYHVGHFFLKYMRADLEGIGQIDAFTGEEETRRSVLSRSIRLAQCLRKTGLQPGDVVVLGGKNHLDVHIPLYACALNGLPLAGVDPLYKYNEILPLFKTVAPKVAFCEPEIYDDYIRAARDLGLATRVITFGAGSSGMSSLMNSYQDLEPEHMFQVATFDLEKIPCWLMSTSGTTGVPKVAAHSHSNILMTLDISRPDYNGQTRERKRVLNVSSAHWVSAYFNAMTMVTRDVKLQSSGPTNAECIIDAINKYKPITTIITPTLLADVMYHEKDCDLTCFDIITITGVKIQTQTLEDLRVRVRPDTEIVQGYGQTEFASLLFDYCPTGPLGNVGTPSRKYEVKLVAMDSGRTIVEPRVPGELWIRGPIMMCYYNDPKSTADVLTEDGFLKTGDILYRDENNYYFYVDRQKMLLKYRCYQVVPFELETVILSHPGVLDVCVTSVPHPSDGEHAVACVRRRPGASVTAQELKELVASQLSVYKHLHGGVVFVDEFPITPSGKINRHKVTELVQVAERE